MFHWATANPSPLGVSSPMLKSVISRRKSATLFALAKRKGFVRGAIAMIDALGFKGVWGANPARPDMSALRTLRAVRAAVEKESKEIRQNVVRLGARVPGPFQELAQEADIVPYFTSDSITIAAWFREAPARLRRDPAADALAGTTRGGRELMLEGLMRFFVCRCVIAALGAAAKSPRPLAYRGAVSTGFFLIEAPYLIGPAVDDAASYMNMPDGAFVWITPRGNKPPHSLTYPPDQWPRMVRVCEMPLRDGRVVSAKILNPFATSDNTEERELIKAGIMKSMVGDALDIVIKRQGTRRILGRFEAFERMQERKLKKANTPS